MLNTLDDYLIDRVFQPVADEYQRATSKNNFMLAALLFTATGFAQFTWVLIKYKETAVLEHFMLLGALLSSFLAQGVITQGNIYKSFRGSYKNPLRYYPLSKMIRIAVLLSTPLFLWGGLAGRFERRVSPVCGQDSYGHIFSSRPLF